VIAAIDEILAATRLAVNGGVRYLSYRVARRYIVDNRHDGTSRDAAQLAQGLSQSQNSRQKEV